MLSWILSIVVALLTGIAALFVAGVVASLCVDWYRISSFEGGSGYFVVFTALGGAIAGGFVGLVVARLIANGAHPGFLNALGASIGAVLLIGGLIAAVARLLADVPPTIDGQRLLLEVELRWPASGAPEPAALKGVGALTLGSSTIGHTRRVSRDGPLWMERASRVDGRWVVPGALEIFTNRGTRVLDMQAGDKRLAGFVLPMKGTPDRHRLEWSEWLPKARPGAAPLPDQFTYRFRVVKAESPLRVDSVGVFSIGTAVAYFYRSHPAEEFGASSTFRIGFGGKPVPGLQDVRAAAVVRESPAALLVEATDDGGETSCRLVLEDGGSVRIEIVAPGAGTALDAAPVTSDETLFRDAKARTTPRGWLDRGTYRVPGLFLLGDAVLDTRSMTVRRLTAASEFSIHTGVPPLGVSPDERSIIRYGYAESQTEKPALLVAPLDGGEAYTLPVDRARMRFVAEEELGPDWVQHHFEWVKGESGADRLTERRDFSPLPYRGRMTVESGDAHYYKLAPAGTALRTALEAFLVSEMKAERVDTESPAAYTHTMKVDGRLVQLSASDDSGYVMVSPDYAMTDQTVVDRIAERFDASLASGKYDSLFLK